MTLRIGISATILVDPQTRDALDGIGVYTRELRLRFESDSRVELVLAVMGARAVRAAPADVARMPTRPSVAALRSILTGGSHADAQALARRIDVYHATDYRVPRLRGVPVCATVYDAIPLSHPQWANPSMRRSKNWVLRHSMRFADRVIAISQAMVPDIIEHYGVDERRITVVPMGVDDAWFAATPPAERAAVHARHGVSAPYFLAVGTLQPRKNVERVVAAYLSLPQPVRDAHRLLVVGRVGWSADSIVALLRAHAASGVQWLERVTDADLRCLYQDATAFVFPSLYEGFGLPVLEAFASGTPVITSNVTSLPEVAGDAACLVDPRDTEAIAAAMNRVSEERAWADSLRERGRARARQFTWEACAEGTLRVLGATAALGSASGGGA